jgi:hypothetical protein
MGRTYFCGVCHEPMKTDLREGEGELRAHFEKVHSRKVRKENGADVLVLDDVVMYCKDEPEADSVDAGGDVDD